MPLNKRDTAALFTIVGALIQKGWARIEGDPLTGELIGTTSDGVEVTLGNLDEIGTLKYLLANPGPDRW